MLIHVVEARFLNEVRMVVFDRYARYVQSDVPCTLSCDAVSPSLFHPHLVKVITSEVLTLQTLQITLVSLCMFSSISPPSLRVSLCVHCAVSECTGPDRQRAVNSCYWGGAMEARVDLQANTLPSRDALIACRSVLFCK